MFADRSPAETERADSTAQLVNRFQHGSDRESSFRDLFERFYPAVLSFFARRGLCREDCRDLTQDTFFSVYRGLEGFKGQSRFETWLFQVAANLYSNMIRRQRTLKRHGQEMSLNGELDRGQLGALELGHAGARDPSGPFARALANERLKALYEALGQLPPRMRLCVALRLDHDLRYRDIAALLEISEGAVKAQLHHARKRLKDTLSEVFDDFDELDEAPEKTHER